MIINFKKILAVVSFFTMMVLVLVPCNSAGQVAALKGQAFFHADAESTLKLDGVAGERLRANLENWELKVPSSNPALIEMFYDRDREPFRDLLPWSGEFVGKYLCASILSYRLLKDPHQEKLIKDVVSQFLSSQGADGYLGPLNKGIRLTGGNWDIWGHYWAIRAFLLFDETFHSPKAVSAAVKAADLLVDKFLNKDFHFTNDGSQGQMNYSVIHAFTKLYELTGKPSYLEMARWIVKEWDLPGAGNYMTFALAGKELYEFPGRRWESLHGFLGMYDMYRITGEEKFRQAFEHIWYSIQKGDRHNTGGFTSGEQATGNPYGLEAIETCCTVAWTDMSIEMLRLTGNPQVADELELSFYNGLLSGQHPNGRWWTYNTPMDGTKEASAHTINFQCRPGSPELNCCSVNGPRGMALISDWALMKSDKTIAVNFYGPGSYSIKTPQGKTLTLRQQTTYPKNGNINIVADINQPEKFIIQLRIPSWSEKTSVKVNGRAASGVKSGSYLEVDRTWKKGDKIELVLDMTPHYWAGEKEEAGKTSIYYGPLLLAFDPAYNVSDAKEMTSFNAADLKLVPATTDKTIQPWVLFSVKQTDGKEIRLCDFTTAGAYGNRYISWLPIKGVTQVSYSKDIPIWANRKMN